MKRSLLLTSAGLALAIFGTQAVQAQFATVPMTLAISGSALTQNDKSTQNAKTGDWTIGAPASSPLTTANLLANLAVDYNAGAAWPAGTKLVLNEPASVTAVNTAAAMTFPGVAVVEKNGNVYDVTKSISFVAVADTVINGGALVSATEPAFTAGTDYTFASLEAAGTIAEDTVPPYTETTKGVATLTYTAVTSTATWTVNGVFTLTHKVGAIAAATGLFPESDTLSFVNGAGGGFNAAGAPVLITGVTASGSGSASLPTPFTGVR